MFLTKKHLSRRTVLKGAGAVISLPLLDAMIPAGTALADTPAVIKPRLGYVYFPHGAIQKFWTPDGTPVPACPTLPGPRGEIAACHDADITLQTIVPAWYGERLDLDYAIGVCFANAEINASRAKEKEQALAMTAATAA